MISARRLEAFCTLLLLWASSRTLTPSAGISPQRRYPRDSRASNGAGWTAYSYRGADEFVLEHFHSQPNGTYVDAGCNQPFIGSNTAALDVEFGWRGWCVDANAKKLARYEGTRSCRLVHAILAQHSGQMATFTSGDTSYQHHDYTLTLGQAIREARAPRRINYLSLCIQGQETRILDSWLLLSFEFDVISVCQPTFEADKLLAKYHYQYVRGVGSQGAPGPPYEEALYVRSPPVVQYNFTRRIERAIQRELPGGRSRPRWPRHKN